MFGNSCVLKLVLIWCLICAVLVECRRQKKDVHHMIVLGNRDKSRLVRSHRYVYFQMLGKKLLDGVAGILLAAIKGDPVQKRSTTITQPIRQRKVTVLRRIRVMNVLHDLNQNVTKIVTVTGQLPAVFMKKTTTSNLSYLHRPSPTLNGSRWLHKNCSATFRNHPPIRIIFVCSREVTKGAPSTTRNRSL